MGNNWILTSYCDCRSDYGLFNTKLHDSPTLSLGIEPLFIGGVLIDCISPSLVILLLGRFMQGIGTGLHFR